MKITIAIALAALAALTTRADYFNGTANFSYQASGSFAITNTIGQGDVFALFPTGRSGNFYLSSSIGPTGGEPGDYYWEIFADAVTINLPIPAPWDQRIIGNRLPTDLVQLVRIGEPYNLTGFGFTAHLTENWYASNGYLRWYETTLSVDPTNFSFDGIDSITLQGNWSFESHLYLEEGRRPDAVPEGNAAVLGAIAIMGLGFFRRLSA